MTAQHGSKVSQRRGHSDVFWTIPQMVFTSESIFLIPYSRIQFGLPLHEIRLGSFTLHHKEKHILERLLTGKESEFVVTH